MTGLPSTGRARSLRRGSTDAERKLWRLLRDRQLNGAKFRRQVPIGPYVVDFLCFDARHTKSKEIVSVTWFEKSVPAEENPKIVAMAGVAGKLWDALMEGII